MRKAASRVAKERSLVGKEWRRRPYCPMGSIVNRKQAATGEIGGPENIAVAPRVPAVWKTASMVDIEDWVAMAGVLSRFPDSAPGGAGCGFVAARAAGERQGDPS